VATIAEWIRIDENNVLDGLNAASEKLAGAEGELVLDFTAVLRVDPAGLKALGKLAERAKRKSVKLVLRGVHVDVYRVLKLARLAPHFTFLV